MNTMTSTEVSKSPALLKEKLQDGPVEIIWREAKPGGKVIFKAIAKKREIKNVD